jgi:hypothetical protein
MHPLGDCGVVVGRAWEVENCADAVVAE